MVVGAWLAFWGLRLEINGFRLPTRDSDHILSIVRGLRLGILGLAVAGIGAAWIWHLTWLFVLSLVIGIEEMVEISIVIHFLKRAEHRAEKSLTPP